MIKLENVLFKYKNTENKVLDNLNLEVNDGEVVAIVGENGSGKSTIGKLIAGILKPKQGKITIDDKDVKNANVGIVFQNPENQIIFSSIYDELAFSLKGLEKAEIEARINKALEEVGMLEYKNKNLYTLSLGQKQRIMIAEVLAKKSKIIVFDEPTTMIDSKGKESIYKIIENLKKEGYTIVCITNLAAEILIADRTLVLKDGKIAFEIKKDELIEKADILRKYGVKLPILLEVLTKLKENGININMEDFTVDELVSKLKGILKNEGCN